MDADSLAIAAAVVLAIALLVLYFVATARERGRAPHYTREVYLYYDPSAPALDPAGVATALGAEVATMGQVTEYAAAGGEAHGYGLTRGGFHLGLTPSGTGALVPTPFPGTAPEAHGVWLYGPKPRRATKGVLPFGCGRWFQPER